MQDYILAVVDDLFFAAKIKAAATNATVELRFAKTNQQALAMAENQVPRQVLVDLHNGKADPLALARLFKENEKLRRAKLVGFFSHVHIALMREAQAAGFDTVMPRSAFTKQLPALLGCSVAN
jgi:ActR/RegA family two-component response regulator